MIDGIVASRSHLCAEVLHEVELRESRRDNLMIYGLPEHTDGSLVERKEHDESAVQELFEDVEVYNARTLEVRRVGRTIEGRPRPVKVKIEDRNSKQKILNNAKLLQRSSHFKNVYIKNDLTKLQQEEFSKLRMEMQRRRKEGEDVVIYSGQVWSRERLRNFRYQF